MQRLPSMAAKKWVYGTWHEADIGSPGSAVASMTGIEVAAVIQRARPVPASGSTNGRLDDSRLGSWFAVLLLLTHDFLFDLA